MGKCFQEMKEDKSFMVEVYWITVKALQCE